MIWPVAASASTAPLAFTPPGAPVTWIAGLTDGRGLDGVAEERVGAIAACLAGRGLSFPAAGAQAATPAAITATAASETTRVLNRMPLPLSHRQPLLATGARCQRFYRAGGCVGGRRGRHPGSFGNKRTSAGLDGK